MYTVWATGGCERFTRAVKLHNQWISQSISQSIKCILWKTGFSCRFRPCLSILCGAFHLCVRPSFLDILHHSFSRMHCTTLKLCLLVGEFTHSYCCCDCDCSWALSMPSEIVAVANWADEWVSDWYSPNTHACYSYCYRCIRGVVMRKLLFYRFLPLIRQEMNRLISLMVPGIQLMVEQRWWTLPLCPVTWAAGRKSDSAWLRLYTHDFI